MAAFSYILDTIQDNVATIIALNKDIHSKKLNSFDFRQELINLMVHPLKTSNLKLG